MFIKIFLSKKCLKKFVILSYFIRQYIYYVLQFLTAVYVKPFDISSSHLAMVK